MDLLDAIKTRRSVRKFSDKPIDADVLERVLDAARLAPSANNVQPWHFVLVVDPGRRAKLAELCNNQTFIAKTPVVIAACGRSYPSKFHWIGEHMAIVDVTIAVDHLTLAARAEGLGTCWIGAFTHDPVHAFLELPDTHRVMWIMPIGYPLDEGVFAETNRRRPFGEMISKERFEG